MKGQFKPVDIIISSAEPAQPSEIISQVLPVVPATEEPLHEATENQKEGEAHAPLVQVMVERGEEKQPAPEPQYSSWDASKSVASKVLNIVN